VITFKTKTRLVVPAVLLAATLGLAGCAAPAASSSTGGGTGTFTPAEVAAASGANQVVPIFAVPKSHDPIRLAFLNPSKGYASFAAWASGMEDAAKFYGVQLDEADLNFKYETSLDAYQQLSVKQPDVLGSGAGAMNDPTLQAATANKTPVVLIDQTLGGAKDFGVSDQEVGSLAIKALAPTVLDRQTGAWKGKDLYVVGLSTANCAPCDNRIKQSLTDAQKTFGIDASKTISLQPGGADPTTGSQDAFTDFLTAHPGAVVAVVSYGDEPVIGAMNAAKAADRAADVVGEGSGGDAAARAYLRDPANKNLFIGSIDFQQYSEGWNWVEAAIATHLGKSFSAYKVTRILTSDNVDKFYPDDK
jgi:ABC-type sugar transport system substrate-binding protein